MVGSAVLALSSRKPGSGAGRWLKLSSGAVLLALGAIMLLGRSGSGPDFS